MTEFNLIYNFAYKSIYYKYQVRIEKCRPSADVKENMKIRLFDIRRIVSGLYFQSYLAHKVFEALKFAIHSFIDLIAENVWTWKRR